MNRLTATLLFLCAAILATPAQASVITMSWTPIGNPGNAADTTGYGSVPYSYNIGTYDVTEGQYVAFLNSNDPNGTDPLGLYNTGMTNYGGVTFNSGNANGSMYSVVSGDGQLPINCVTWYDTIRFANWMNNGQPVFATEPTATNNATENGAYTLLGFTPTPSNGNSITRNNGATVVLPSENEWYKAAYYNPATQSYFTYPTSSNTAPTATTPTSTPNSANYDDAVGDGFDPSAALTAVGAYLGTTSPYGAYDMGGDVWQWNEELYVDGESRDVRGDSFDGVGGYMESSFSSDDDPSDGYFSIGFRVASVPEPSSFLLALIGCGAAILLRKRVRAALLIRRPGGRPPEPVL